MFVHAALILFVSVLFSFLTTATTAVLSASSHTSNYAVVVSASRYWFNYRHNANALTIYQILKENGFTDDHIILMLADEYAANPRNPFRNRIFTAGSQGPSLYNGTQIEIDYRGDDVTVENLVNVLTGRQTRGLPVLSSNRESNILLYLTGHGGNQFFKFQDVEEIMADHLASTLRQMHISRRYREILLVADTCQAFTLGDKVGDIPNITVIGSSLKDESSYAHHSDSDLGLSVIERYTHSLNEFMRERSKADPNWWYNTSIQDAMVTPYPFEKQGAHIGVRDDSAVRKVAEVPIGDFFVSVATATATSDRKGNVPNSSRTWKLYRTPVKTHHLMITDDYSFLGEIDQSANNYPDHPTAWNPIAAPAPLTSHSNTPTLWSEGANPSDPFFILLVMVIFGLISTASLKW